MKTRGNLRFLASSALFGAALAAVTVTSRSAQAQLSECGANSGSLCAEIKTCHGFPLWRNCGTQYLYYPALQPATDHEIL